MLSLLIVKGPSAWTERIRAKRNKHSWCSKQNTKPFFFFLICIFLILYSVKRQEFYFFLFIVLGSLTLWRFMPYLSKCVYESACSTRYICDAVAVYKTSKAWNISIQKDVVKVMSLKTDIPWGWLKDFYLKKSIRVLYDKSDPDPPTHC